MAKWQRFRVDIPEGYTPIEREAIALEIIERIIERSKSGKDKDGKSFPGYSEEYKKSLDFKIAGKSKTGPVNLILSGEMLETMELLSHEKGSLLIGYDKSDTDLNGKVEGNVTGSYGGSASSKRARDFLGITNDEKKGILAKFPLTKKERNETKKLAAQMVAAFNEGLDSVGFEEDEDDDEA